MDTVKTFYKEEADGIIAKLAKRGFEGYYVPDGRQAADKLLELLPQTGIVGWGGSQTLTELKIPEQLAKTELTLIDRRKAANAGEKHELCRSMFTADVFLMSTNAITLEGELVNVDGDGNRVGCLCYGPDTVIVMAGMNKVVPDIEAGIRRTRGYSSGLNSCRLNRQTPCSKTGKCAECTGDESICSQIVVTRLCHPAGRIKVILIGETLGY